MCIMFVPTRCQLAGCIAQASHEMRTLPAPCLSGHAWLSLSPTCTPRVVCSRQKVAGSCRCRGATVAEEWEHLTLKCLLSLVSASRLAQAHMQSRDQDKNGLLVLTPMHCTVHNSCLAQWVPEPSWAQRSLLITSLLKSAPLLRGCAGAQSPLCPLFCLTGASMPGLAPRASLESASQRCSLPGKQRPALNMP